MTRLPQDEAAIAAMDTLRDLPVFAELEAAHGPAGAGSGPHLAGKPVTMHTGVTRMVWVWFEDGQNRNIAIDTTSAASMWTWQIRAAGAAGRIRFDQTTGQPPSQDLIRAIAAAAGLLPGTMTGAEEMTPAEAFLVVSAALPEEARGEQVDMAMRLLGGLAERAR